MNHLLKDNLALITARSNKAPEPDHFFCSDKPVETKCGESTTQSVTIPLKLYGSQADGSIFGGEESSVTPNLSPEFLAALKERVGAIPLGPDDVFAYMYAVLFSPGYRVRYGAFLRRDFPRIPLPSDGKLMKKLAGLGNQLIDLHLMRANGPNQPGYPSAGNNRVDAVDFKDGRVYINGEQYFDGVSRKVWDYHIGGYQVAHKWLKDRKGRQLTFDDLHHYRRVIAALDETIRVQSEIDAAVPAWPIP